MNEPTRPDGTTPTPGSPDLGILYEHPDWFRPLFRELERRGIPFERLDVRDHHFDPSERVPSHRVIFNRVSPSAHLRGARDAVFYTTQYLEHLERVGARVINGLGAWRTEVSKAAQLTLLEELGLPYPRARVIHRPETAARVAAALRFPVVVKPNVGGSGAGVTRFESADELGRAAAEGTLDLGVDETALVQEFVPARDGRITRVEVLNGRFLYAIRIYTPGDQFNLCPADVCQDLDGAQLERAACPADAPSNDLKVEAYDPPGEVVREVEAIAATSGIEIGGVEYMVDDRDGRILYYDVNALSNFVADGPRVLGFDPVHRLADWLEEELAATVGGGGGPEAPSGTGASERAGAGEVAP